MSISSHVKRISYKVGVGGTLSILSRFPIGTHVKEREWDTLILLDTCRVDAIKSVEAEHEFLSDIGSLYSLGSTSSEWIAQTFTQEWLESEKVGYISGNGWSKRVLEDRIMPEEDKGALLSATRWNVGTPSMFEVLDHAWKFDNQEQFNLSKELPHPRTVTDRAIEIHRNKSTKTDRMVIHYSQPHAPYTAPAIKENRKMKKHEAEPFKYLREGGEPERVWEAYVENLKFVLDEVKLLLKNITSEKVIISADHGELFGRWGIYGHPACLPVDDLRRVPWVITDASDQHTHTPDLPSVPQRHDPSEQLESLGYLE